MATTTAPTDRPRPVPGPIPSEPGIPLPPDSISYRLKRRLLGAPLHSEELEHQRLGKPTALAVFASDNLSSSAYATEEILHVLLPVAGVVAFSLVMPITIAMCVVLGFLILSYRETIKEYPSAGGAYLVTKDNFGPTAAQVAGASLLIDYILTVAVSSAAGTAALDLGVRRARALPRADRAVLHRARRLRQPAGRQGVGADLRHPHLLLHAHHGAAAGHRRLEVPGRRPARLLGRWRRRASSPSRAWRRAASGLLLGVKLYDVLHAFASGGAAVTGVEAISNGVPAFRKPEWRNARQTLVIMGVGLGVMFLGLSALAAEIHVRPFESGSPTVISQIGEAVFGGGPVGDVLYYALQAGTMLILIMAANTGFADFPRLASFQAGDSFLPRQLTKRGHRLVYSNGIIALAGAAMVARRDHRGRGHAADPALRHRRVHRLHAVAGRHDQAPLAQARAGLAQEHASSRGSARCCRAWWRSIIAVTKFADGAWAILIILPLLVVILLRLNRQYVREAAAPRGRRARRRHRPDPAPPRRAGPRRPARPRLPPGRSSTPARSPPTSCGPSTSSSTTRRPATWPRNGAGSACTGCRSSWSSAPTGASPAPRSRRSPAS